ncbi:hypothetical protein [Candidatus Villigracilis saccharophilus]|uniref:hypothetical protein n=1 Tax=Candidatus Villigracilis saccharophilus TaxID=3140684 RepID=UPI0031EF61F7
MDLNGYTCQISIEQYPQDARTADASARHWTDFASPVWAMENTMPFIMECVPAYATLGEIVGVMKETFGEYEELAVI